MKELRKWKNKGSDFSCLDDDGRLLPRSLKGEILYPFDIEYKDSNIMYANSGVGIRERIKVVDDAILAAHNFNLIN